MSAALTEMTATPDRKISGDNEGMLGISAGGFRIRFDKIAGHRKESSRNLGERATGLPSFGGIPHLGVSGDQAGAEENRI
jgi:hypothetical protein